MQPKFFKTWKSSTLSKIKEFTKIIPACTVSNLVCECTYECKMYGPCNQKFICFLSRGLISWRSASQIGDLDSFYFTISIKCIYYMNLQKKWIILIFRGRTIKRILIVKQSQVLNIPHFDRWGMFNYLKNSLCVRIVFYDGLHTWTRRYSVML